MNHSPESIRNFRRLDDRVSTGGQPTEEQLAALAVSGVQAVINLALPTSTHALPDERAVVTGLGMEYVAIPVVFEAPAAADFARFCAEMAARRGQRLFIHCALNCRVSAFVALRRVLQEGWSRESAWAALREIWEPDEVWSRFLEECLGAVAPALTLPPPVAAANT